MLGNWPRPHATLYGTLPFLVLVYEHDLTCTFQFSPLFAPIFIWCGHTLCTPCVLWYRGARGTVLWRQTGVYDPFWRNNKVFTSCCRAIGDERAEKPTRSISLRQKRERDTGTCHSAGHSLFSCGGHSTCCWKTSHLRLVFLWRHTYYPI